MSEVTNHDRANWAHEAIKLFAEITEVGVGEEAEETAFRDLLVNLRHWSSERGIDYTSASEDALAVYEEEVTEEEGHE